MKWNIYNIAIASAKKAAVASVEEHIRAADFYLEERKGKHSESTVGYYLSMRNEALAALKEIKKIDILFDLGE